MLVIAHSMGVKRKGGGEMKLKDYVPDWALDQDQDHEAAEKKLKNQLIALARASKKK